MDVEKDLCPDCGAKIEFEKQPLKKMTKEEVEGLEHFLEFDFFSCVDGCGWCKPVILIYIEEENV